MAVSWPLWGRCPAPYWPLVDTHCAAPPLSLDLVLIIGTTHNMYNMYNMYKTWNNTIVISSCGAKKDEGWNYGVSSRSKTAQSRILGWLAMIIHWASTWCGHSLSFSLVQVNILTANVLHTYCMYCHVSITECTTGAELPRPRYGNISWILQQVL